MKTFYEWLKFHEMPLSFYGTQFNNPIKKGFKPPVLRSDGDQLRQDGSYAVRGDLFTHRDKAIIDSPKTKNILFEKLKISKYNINIIMLEDSFSNTFKTYKDIATNYIKQNNIQTENHITFFKKSSSGHMLKPKMILHTLAHAVSIYGVNFAGRNKIEYENLSKFSKLVDQLYDQSPFKENSERYGRISPEFLKFLKMLFVFDSVQNERIADQDDTELLHELIAEYLWTGGNIRVKPDFEENFEKYSAYLGSQNYLDALKNINTILQNIKYIIEKMLDSCVGQIIYD